MENRLSVRIVFKPRGFVKKTSSYVKFLLTKFTKGEQDFFPIQNQAFDLSVVFKNVGDNVFEGALIKNIVIRGKTSVPFQFNSQKEFIVQNLNPSESVEIFIETMKQIFSGEAWLSFGLVPKNSSAQLHTYQIGVDNVLDKFAVPNGWGGSFIVRSKFETAQEKTNNLVFILTMLTFIEAIWGLKNVYQGLLRCLLSFLTFLAGIINRLI